ncbi:FAD assembly factor SdhE [Andreprevotia chitinilytica]|uniref:FAD assembly factor SdhE n=1 Tax=Andreprevotia chitinilytica TaxID=396808 RepID=UPI00069092D2|nr:succinate dehydrogenase assembly factor 2 [Andreprevotia chitinilytica]
MIDEVELKRILWRSRRGLLELDLQLERFVNGAFQGLSAAELEDYRRLLLLPDQDFLEYLNGKAECPDVTLRAIIERIQAEQR